MPVISLIIILAVIGLLLWAVITYIPMEPTIKRIMIAVVVIGTIIWLLQVFGIIGTISAIHIGK